MPALNAATLELVKQFEGFVDHWYPDPASGGKPYTCCYGHTDAAGPPFYAKTKSATFTKAEGLAASANLITSSETHMTDLAADRFRAALDKVLIHEGGYVDHPKDPGGATNLGITRKVLAEWRGIVPYTKLPKMEVAALTVAEASAIYKARFWDAVRGDVLPAGLDLVTFDGAVNSGPQRSIKWTQKGVGVEADGVFGAKTLTAVQNANVPKAIKAACAARLGFVRSLAIWNTFGKGWSRRIADVEATALSWVLTKPELEREAKEAKDKATQQAGGAVVVTGGGVADQASGGLSGLPWWGIAIVVVLIAAPLVIRLLINRQRAAAIATAASAKGA